VPFFVGFLVVLTTACTANTCDGLISNTILTMMSHLIFF